MRKLRENAELSVKQAGAVVGMGGPQLSHIEAGRTGLDALRLETLLDSFGCTDATYRQELLAMGASNGKGWWTTYRDRVPKLSLDLAELEERSLVVDDYETFYIPGHLQITEYAEAIYTDAYRSKGWDVGTAVEFRTERQRILFDEERQFRFVIHEAALQMRFPGAEVMRAQLLHLLRAAERPNVTIQVLPFTVERMPPHAGPFLLCDPGSPDLATIVLDHPSRTEYLGDATSIATFRETFSQLSALALPAVDTAREPRAHSSRDSWGIIQHLLYLLQL